MERENLILPPHLEDSSWPLLYAQVAEKLEHATRVLILGAEPRQHLFYDGLKKNFPALAKKVVGCENCELTEPVSLPTDQQIASYAIRYFQKPIKPIQEGQKQS